MATNREVTIQAAGKLSQVFTKTLNSLYLGNPLC